MATHAQGRRIDTVNHNGASWHIHQVAHDFELIDAWRLPIAGDHDEFSEFVELFCSLDLGADDGSRASTFLFDVRNKLGAVMGWDDEVLTQPIPGCEETSLRDRLSAELRNSAESLDGDGSAFQLVYQTDDEAVLEISNSTVHAAIHFAWVAANDRCVGQMGIYVKHRGRLGRLYMPAIAPFRHYIVYPALMRRLGSAWDQRSPGTATRPLEQ